MLCAVASLPSLPLYRTGPGTEENDRLWPSACSLSTPWPLPLPLLGTLPQEEEDLPDGVGFHVYPSSTLYPQDPYSQGTKADTPGLGSPTTAPCSAARETVWKKNSLKVIISQGNPQSQSRSARRFLFVKPGGGGGRFPPSRLASACG